MRRKYPEEGSVPADQGCGLDGTKTSRNRDVQMHGKKRISSDVRNQYRMAGAHCPRASAFVLDIHSGKVLKKVQPKATLSHNRKLARLPIHELHVAHFCAMHSECHGKQPLNRATLV